MDNQEILHKSFIEKLEVHYGFFDANKNKFESTSNSKIARDLFYSDSQFSRLVNNTASEGELTRAVNNAQRLLDFHSFKEKLEKPIKNNETKKYSWKYFGFLFLLILAACLITFYISTTEKTAQIKSPKENTSRYDMLKWSFENNYIKSYITLKELPEDCNFPSYKYQGKWELKEEYKIPFFRERNGFHYVAKKVVMYATSGDKTNNDGKSFEGYEYQKHEIWYDIREFPIDSFLVKSSSSKVRPKYNLSKFEENKNFVKIALIHTFFRTRFIINGDKIERSGKTIGRDLEFLPDEILSEKLNSKILKDDVKNEVNSIAKNRLEDFSKPISCYPSEAPNEDFNLIEQGDELSFDCQFSTGRFLVDYTKTYILKDQYINNYCR